MTRHRLSRHVLVVLWVCACSASVQRRALASAAGTLFSSPASPDAASSTFNPGAMTLLDGTHVMLFGGVSFIRLQYQRATPNPNTGAPYPAADVFVPKPAVTLGVVSDLTLDRFRFGLNATIPMLDGASWKMTYDGQPSSTRYYASDARQLFITISPSVAFRIHRVISVGVGLDIVGVQLAQTSMTDFGAKINQIACGLNSGGGDCPIDAPLPREDPTYDAKTELSGMGWGVGGFAGVLVTPHPRLRLALGFHSGAGTVTIPADITVQLPHSVRDYVTKNLPSVVLPTLSAKADIKVNSPVIVTAGVAFDATDALELAADLQWINYSTTATTSVNIVQTTTSLVGDQMLVKDRADVFLIGLRGAYRFLPGLRAGLRVEYENNTRPEPFVSPISIDYHKVSLHAAVGWHLLDALEVTLEYGHYFLIARSISTSYFAPNASAKSPVEQAMDKPSPTGKYTGVADRVGVGIIANF